MKYKLGDEVYLKGVITSISFCGEINYPYKVKTADEFILAAEQHLEPVNKSELGHAEEAPRYLRNVLARLRELPKHDREVWLKGIMDEFELDFSHAKWREGYEQGKFDGAVEAEKPNTVVIPQFVAEWIEKAKTTVAAGTLKGAYINAPEKIRLWLSGDNAANVQLFARAWLDGYEINDEEEKRYLVKIRATKHYFSKDGNGKIYFSLAFKSYFTKKELEEAGFGWIWDVPEIIKEEVE